MEKKYILFDLDGTLTDSADGIINSVIYALKSYGIEADDRDALRAFVGPPLAGSFSKYYGFDERKSLEAVERYGNISVKRACLKTRCIREFGKCWGI